MNGEFFDGPEAAEASNWYDNPQPRSRMPEWRGRHPGYFPRRYYAQPNPVLKILKAHEQRIGRNEYAQAASKVMDEFKGRFPDLFENNNLIRTAFPLASLLFLKPEKKGKGFESVIFDPRVWGPVLAGGIALFDSVFNKLTLQLDGPLEGAVGDVGHFGAIAEDRRGQPISPQPTSFEWTSSNPAVAEVVDQKTGQVTGRAQGTALITVITTVGGKRITKSRLFRVN